MAGNIDWESINAKLPFERTDEAKEKRKDLFKQFDPNGNGFLSLAEVSGKSTTTLTSTVLNVMIFLLR